MTRTPTILMLTLILTLGAAAPALAADLDAATQQALAAALDDERQAQATYRAAVERYGAGPFVRVVEAEGRHERHLLDLYDTYGLEPPADRWAEAEIELPETLAEACAEAAEWETGNAALFDDLLATVQAPDVRQVFQTLQSRSRDRHLPAFQRCAEGAAGGGMGCRHGAGPGQGKGPGQGMGPGQRMGHGQGTGHGQGRMHGQGNGNHGGGRCAGSCGHGGQHRQGRGCPRHGTGPDGEAAP